MFYLHKGLSKNYASKNVGMKCTHFCALAETLFSSESGWTPKTQPNEWYVIFGQPLSASLFWEILPVHETTNKYIGFPLTNNGTTCQNLDLCL